MLYLLHELWLEEVTAGDWLHEAKVVVCNSGRNLESVVTIFASFVMERQVMIVCVTNLA